jgi:hypothetical protein
MKSELLLSNRLKGLELFIDIRKNYPILSSWLCQDIALYLFNNQQLPQKDLEHLVANGITEVNFMDHFIYEDDPFGHYEWFIQHASGAQKQSQDFQNFKELFAHRKELLKGKATDEKSLPIQNINQSVLYKPKTNTLVYELFQVLSKEIIEQEHIPNINSLSLEQLKQLKGGIKGKISYQFK